MTVLNRPWMTHMQFTKGAPKSVALAFLQVENSFAQLYPGPIIGDLVMDFETPKGWAVKSSSPATIETTRPFAPRVTAPRSGSRPTPPR
jgi:hypothetical protein